MLYRDREFGLRSLRTVQVCCGTAFALSVLMTTLLAAVPTYGTESVSGTFVQVNGLLSLLFMTPPIAFTGLILYHVLKNEVIAYKSKTYLWLAGLLFLAYGIVTGTYGVFYAPSILVLLLAAWVNSGRRDQQAQVSSNRP